MRIPEAFFPLINRIVRLLLNSPLHGLMSGSVMVVYYTGRRTGKRRWTPVRYLREEDGGVVCLTGRETGWWPNFLERHDVALQLAGRRVAARAHARPDATEHKTSVLRETLERFPADAPYDDFKTLSFEARQKLTRVRPQSIAQAGRIPGVSPADLQNLVMEVRRMKSAVSDPGPKAATAST